MSGLIRLVLGIAGSAGVGLMLVQTGGRVGGGTTFDQAAPRGANFDKAQFRLWVPSAAPVRAVVVLVPGSNEDGRAAVADPVWQGFAVQHRLALLGCWFTDKPHVQNFIEEYVGAARGTGQALVDGLGALSTRSKHPELAGAPLLLWGMSAGGEFNYEFVAWRPERVAAFVVNKGGIYYTALAPEAARNVPGLLFVGEKDLEFRTQTIVGLFALNRRAGARWALTQEPGVAHAVGRSRDMTLIFFEDVLGLRLREPALDEPAAASLNLIPEKAGFVGDVNAHTITAAGNAAAAGNPTAWLPTARVARAWQALAAQRPFDP